jgi:uncharacterized protein with LGFP repeats
MPTNIGKFTVFGAIEQKWLSLGGSKGLLGDPLSNEGATFDGVGRAQTFRGGVVSWHPQIGPHEVHGAILARWLEVGRERFGYPITDESSCPDKIGRFNHFRALQFPGPPESSIYWSPSTGPHDVFGAIRDKWASLGFERSVLGYPTSSASPTFDGAGAAQTFQGGVISWHPTIGAHEVHGAILARWLEAGRERFGHPTTDETPTPDSIGRFNHFRSVELPGGPESSIYWSPSTGPHDVFGAIRDKWASLGFERSVLGYPVESAHAQAGGGATQRFQGGVITWTSTGGPAEHEVSGDTVKFDSGKVNSNLPLNGSVQLVVQRSGNFTFTCNAHDAGFDNISYAMVAILVTAPGTAFQFVHNGHVEGTSAGLPLGTPQRDDHFFASDNNPGIVAHFDEIIASGRLLATLTGEDKLAGAIQDLLAEAAKEAAEAGIKALVEVIAA